MKKIFMGIIGVMMLPGFALANAHNLSSSSYFDGDSAYESQRMEEVRAQEMRDDEIRRERMRKERIHHRYDVNIENLRSDQVSGASAPRYNSDENSSYR